MALFVALEPAYKHLKQGHKKLNAGGQWCLDPGWAMAPEMNASLMWLTVAPGCIKSVVQC